jgi:hypothetical protein
MALSSLSGPVRSDGELRPTVPLAKSPSPGRDFRPPPPIWEGQLLCVEFEMWFRTAQVAYYFSPDLAYAKEVDYIIILKILLTGKKTSVL